MIRDLSTSLLAIRLSGMILILSTGGAFALKAQSFPLSIVPSRWEGEALLGTPPLRVGLSIEAGPNGPSDPLMFLDVPESGVLRLPVSSVSLKGDSVQFSMPMRRALIPFAARVRGNQMDGIANMGAPIPIHFTRVSIPVLPYRVEEITIQHDSIRLASSLYIPSAPGPHPAIVFHHAAYADTREEWRFWADHFARMGIATLTYDNRGAGKTNGDPHVGFEDLAGDALACVAKLKSDARIRGNEIGIFSGSQGGWVASIAAAHSRDVAFVVMVAGPGVTVAKNVLYESESKLRSAKFPDSEIRNALDAKRRIEARIASGASDDEIDRSLAEIKGERWLEYIGIPPRGSWWRTWWRLVGGFDPSPYWARVHIPVLVLEGELDTQVPVEDSRAAFARAFATAGNTDFSFLVFSGAGHGLQLEERPILAPGVVSALSTWVASHVTLPGASK
jgi:pimeloyl-ACP methyl ester carboxylesterase